jgi:prephenate dehydratase
MTGTQKKLAQHLPGIAIQGFEGSFHEEAARQFFGKEIPVVCCATFTDLFKKAADKKETFAAVMAIENSIAGSILANYNLLQRSSLTVIGEVYLHIKQHLMVNTGVQLSDIKEVHSHPMAIQQCLAYLDQYNWKLVETEDTALSAKHVHQHKSKHIAAIAGKQAADLFGLNIIAPSIHTQKNNYTRFLVLQRTKEATAVKDANKASVNFSTDHTKGSLAKVLTKIADAGINLSKLQSFPIPGSNFLYSFHADMEFDNVKQFYELQKKLEGITAHLKVYGLYRSGKR